MVAPNAIPRRGLLTGAATGIVTVVLPTAAAATSGGGGGGGPVGILLGWGSDDDARNGQQLDDATSSTFTPTVASADSGWTVVAAGPTQSLGIRGGRLYAWGSNTSGATGLNTNTGITTTPTEVVVSGVTTWTAVAAGGDNGGAGPSFTLAIGDGRLYSFGDNSLGQTGLGTTTGETLVPTQVGSDSDWTHIAVGAFHALGIRGGALHSWGLDALGGTGRNISTFTSTTAPAQVGSATDWTACTCAVAYASAGIRAGELYSWGSNAGAVTGLGTTSGGDLVPTRVGDGTDWTAVAFGLQSAAGLRSGQLWTWGRNTSGVTAQGSTSGETLEPTRVGSATGWSRISVGGAALMAIRSGELYASGATGTASAPGATGLAAGTAVVTAPTRVGGESDWSAIALSQNDPAAIGLGIRG